MPGPSGVWLNLFTYLGITYERESPWDQAAASRFDIIVKEYVFPIFGIFLYFRYVLRHIQ